MAKRTVKSMAALVAELAALDPVFDVRKQLNDACRVPMGYILAAVPGDNDSERRERLGVSRQLWHRWKHDTDRPNGDNAKRIAALTGFRLWQIQR